MLTIYGKTDCGYCHRAKAHLDRLGVAYEEKTLNKDFTREELLSIYPAARTFPHIIEEDGSVIGGYEQLIKIEKYKLNVSN